MEPTLLDGQLVVGIGLGRPKIQRIVIAKHHGREIIKRVKKYDDGQVYLIGDNIEHSTDSRSFGALKVKDVLSVVIWPRHS